MNMRPQKTIDTEDIAYRIISILLLCAIYSQILKVVVIQI